MRIRTETVADYNGVFQVNVEAFGDREDEAQLVENIRSEARNRQGADPRRGKKM